MNEKMNGFKEKFFEKISEVVGNLGKNILKNSNIDNEQFSKDSEENIYEHVQKLMEITSDNKNEKISSEKENKKNYKIVKVNGNEIRLYESFEDGVFMKRYLIPGVKEAIYKTGDGIKTKRVTIFGYKNNFSSANENAVSDRIKDYRLNIEFLKTIRLGVTEEIKKGALVDVEDNYKGSIERKETTYSNGDKVIEEDKTVIDKRGNNQYVKEVISYIGNEYINTKYLNGKTIFKIVKNKEGTNIIEFDEQGNIKHTYIYDKNGKPTEMISITQNDDTISKFSKIYKGIPEIFDEKTIIEQEGKIDFNNSSKYVQAMFRAGFSTNFAEMIEELKANYFVDKCELEDFIKAKEQFVEKTQVNIDDKEKPLEKIKEKMKELKIELNKANSKSKSVLEQSEIKSDKENEKKSVDKSEEEAKEETINNECNEK